ncbi:bifunctional folylpolyglutamate synthase/dihydrofolate synthase [Litorimonas haliclonae]|uniref:bifunctional folylpolyglutamate synthase/dihydrofolate synthase n=1 Tax=Litorimonas haliclonae TaxID=2081977 RepID=UPI0039EFB94D
MPSQEPTDNRVEQALATLRALHPKKIDLGLDRIESVLAKLGHPERKMPPIIHVAGTNGKGSTVANLRAMAEAAGLKAHVYTSPHLVHFRERIVVSGEEISDESLVDVLTRVREANAGAPLSFFEATTAAAYLAFSESAADIALIEVGLGGRYDATNVIRPTCCAITPIDYDHAEFLGRDLAGIAREKAGIMKSHAPVICGVQSDLVNAVLDAEARKAGADIKIWGQDYRAYRQHGRLIFEQDEEMLDLPLPALRGEHQIRNAGLAVMVARTLGWPAEAIAAGLQKAVWPARLQSLTKGIYAEMAHEAGAELWLDGGHNPHAARAVANAMAELEQTTERPLILITGMLANKDIGGFLDAFEGLASAVIGISIPDHDSLAPETLKELATSRNMLGFVADDIFDAVELAIETGEALSDGTTGQSPTPPRILICGSLYLAGEVLKS